VLGFYRMLEDSPLALVNTSDEQGAAFAADACRPSARGQMDDPPEGHG